MNNSMNTMTYNRKFNGSEKLKRLVMELSEKDLAASNSTNDTSPHPGRGYGFNHRNEAKDYLQRPNWQGKRFVESKRFMNSYQNKTSSYQRYQNSGSSVSDY